LQIHVFNPSQAQRDAHDFDPGGRPVNDHAKVYALQRKDPQKASILLTGTHNLDGQSVKRSHENVMFIESKDRYLTESLFDEFWDSTPEMRKEDIDLLLTEFHKPRSLPKDDWAQMIQSKQALLEKMGLQDKPARN
jgi:phosphatidylserine/phosphatidylglycerophosphate/cardiolipin synthase-like enzyme